MAVTPVSIIIPTLNEERYLPILLESIFRCSSPQMEIVVVDCKSDDKTLDVVEYYKNHAPENITLKSVISDQRNVSYQRNFGVKNATNEILIFLDADTCIPRPDRILELSTLFVEESLAAASCRFLPLDRDPRALLYYTTLYGFHKLMERRNPYALGACIITTKKVFNACHGFDASIKVNEDANFCMKASNFGAFRVLPTVLQISTRRFQSMGMFEWDSSMPGCLFRERSLENVEMIVLNMNGEIMNRKIIAQNQKIVVGFFTLFFFIGLWLTRAYISSSLQVILFHAILLVNTYFSIQCFGRMTPENITSQKVIDTILVILYVLLPFTFSFASLYILIVLLLFIVATAKYVFLLGVISDLKLLKRKILIDLSGIVWNYLVFLCGMLGLVSIDLLLWTWVIVFAGMNLYFLKIKPMYCLTAP